MAKKASEAMLEGLHAVDGKKACGVLINSSKTAACALGCALIGYYGKENVHPATYTTPYVLREAERDFQEEYGISIVQLNDKYHFPIPVIIGMLKAIGH